MGRQTALAPAAAGTPLPIEIPYLLVTHIPVVSDGSGGIWIDRLWHADLARHLAYLRDFTLAAPVLHRKVPKGDRMRLEVPEGTTFRLAPLPRMDSRTRVLLSFPALALAIWKAVGEARLVHASMGGWPYPLALLAIPAARLRRRRSIAVVESTPWRIPEGSAPGLVDRLRARVVEAAVRRTVAGADLTIFTHPGYRASLLGRRAPHGHVIPASWIREEDVLSLDEAESAWREKLARPPEHTRFLFAGRLEPDKGVEVLLEAAARLEEKGVRFELHVIGEGPLRESCRAAAARSRAVRIELHRPLPYGDPFLHFVRRHEAIVVPSLGDEQPRIVFDAFSQAIPLLAADTPGLRAHVDEDATGWRFPSGDSAALADLIERALADRRALRHMGLCARERAGATTHAHMHAERSRLIRQIIEPTRDG